MRRVEIVNRLDKAAAEITPPNAIDGSLGEIRVLWPGNPAGQHPPASSARQPALACFRRGKRRHEHVFTRNADLFNVIGRSQCRAIPARHIKVVEERRERPELRLLPFGEGMVVALRALHLHPQKEPRGVGGQLLGLEFRRLIERQRTRPARCVSVERRGQQLADELVVRHVRRKAQLEPHFKSRRLGARVNSVTRQEKLAPGIRQMCGEGPPLQELFDKLMALVGTRVLEKGAGLSHRRNAPDQIEIDAAHELAVAGRFGRFDALLLPRLLQATIDPSRQLVGSELALQRGIGTVSIRELRGREHRSRRDTEPNAERQKDAFVGWAVPTGTGG